MPMSSSQPVRVFISHSHADNDACLPLLAVLNMLGVSYWFDTEQLKAGNTISSRVQAAINECDIFIRMCSANVQANPYWVNLETNAFRALQAQASSDGRPNQRVLIPFFLDTKYTKQPFEMAVFYIDAASESNWAVQLSKALGISWPTLQVEPATPPTPPTPPQSRTTLRIWLWTYIIVSPVAFYIALVAMFGGSSDLTLPGTGEQIQNFVVVLVAFAGLMPLVIVVIVSLRAQQRVWLITNLLAGIILLIFAGLLASVSVSSLLSATQVNGGIVFDSSQLSTIAISSIPMLIMPAVYSVWGLGKGGSKGVNFGVELIASWAFSAAVALVIVYFEVAVAGSGGSNKQDFVFATLVIGYIPVMLASVLALREKSYTWFFVVLLGSIILFLFPPLLPLVYLSTRMIRQSRRQQQV